MFIGVCCCEQYTVSLLEALVLRRTAPSETYRKLDAMATSLVEQLRLAFKQVLHTVQPSHTMHHIASH